MSETTFKAWSVEKLFKGWNAVNALSLIIEARKEERENNKEFAALKRNDAAMLLESANLTHLLKFLRKPTRNERLRDSGFSI
ncbi:MAG: hypothetical protein ABR981_02010 [Candidatus Micrarchaeaceae archaeon]|jgi:hypothetical protein